MLQKIKKLKIKNIFELVIILISIIPGMILRLIKRNIWIISENGDDAKDNGYALFKYIMENQDNKNVYYVVKKDTIYHQKIKKYSKNIIYQNSLKHNIYTIASSKYISSQIGSGLPFPQIVFNLQGTFLYQFESVFLQHGITQNKVECLLPKESKVDLFCCAGNEEYDFIINDFGYKNEMVKKTGFCRYDYLQDTSNTKNKILIMFTWRKYFENTTEKDFLESTYYKNIEQLIKNERLIEFADKNNLEICFYLHDNMMKYKEQFNVSSNNIKILDKREKSIQELLCESKYLITDYSSVAFDFAYMNKPLQYFQFDYDEFRNNHLKEGYWNYKDGFGNTTKTVEECIDELIKSYNNNFMMEEKYRRKTDKFFIYKDKHNCKRTYEEIKNMRTNKERINTDSYWIINSIIFSIGIIFSKLYLLLGVAVLGVLLNIMYSCKQAKKNIYLLIMNISIFTFLIAKPVISTIEGIDWINKFEVESQVHALSFIIISLLSIYIGARLHYKTKELSTSKIKILQDMNYNNKETIKRLRNISLILFFICAIFAIITEYDKILYMYGKDYVEYYLTYENNFNPLVTMLAGMSNIFLCIFLATMPEKKTAILPIVILVIYNIPTFLIGQRTPLVVVVLFVFAYFVIRDYLENTENWIGKLEKRLLIVIIPICIIGLAAFNYIRVDEELPTKNIVKLFGDFFYSQGVSYDVLNIGYQAKDEIKEISNHNYTFGPFIDYVKYSTISKVLFNTEELPVGNSEERALKSNSYSHILSYLTRTDYLEGHGWGASYILETYTDCGYIGIIIYSVILGAMLARIPQYLKRNVFTSSIILICTLNIFIIPRAEALQFLQFIITPQFWGAWIGCVIILKMMELIKSKKYIIKEE